MAKTKFDPTKCGLTKSKDSDGETEFVAIVNNKVTGKLYHVNYWQGLPIEWSVKKVVHCVNGSTKEHDVYSGEIPNNAFGKQLFKNLLFFRRP